VAGAALVVAIASPSRLIDWDNGIDKRMTLQGDRGSIVAALLFHFV
jgi:hypothetical protein